jgi:hypothetical protein
LNLCCTLHVLFLDFHILYLDLELGQPLSWFVPFGIHVVLLVFVFMIVLIDSHQTYFYCFFSCYSIYFKTMYLSKEEVVTMEK